MQITKSSESSESSNSQCAMKKKNLAKKYKLSIQVRWVAQKMERGNCYCLAALLFQTLLQP